MINNQENLQKFYVKAPNEVVGITRKDIKIVDNFTDCFRKFGYAYSYNKNISMDIETNGLDPFKNQITYITLYIETLNKESGLVVVLNVSGSINTNFVNLISYIERNGTKANCIFHNSKFDLSFLFKNITDSSSNILKAVTLKDTYINEKVLTNGLNLSCSLDETLLRRFNVPLDKTLQTSFNTPTLSNAQYDYCINDCLYLPDLLTVQESELKEKGLVEIAKLDTDVILPLIECESTGMRLDQKEWIELYEKNTKECAKLIKDLSTIIETNPTYKVLIPRDNQLDLFPDPENPKSTIKINWDSSSQVKSFFNAIGINIDNVEEKTIQKFQYDHPIIKTYIDYKKTKKLTTTYGTGFLEKVDENGIIRTNFTVSVATGRMASGGKGSYNQQNIPASGGFMNCFKPVGKDWVFVYADYPGMELILAAEFSGEDSWVEAINNGEDLHGKVASLVFNVPESEVRNKPEFLRGKSYRDIAKTINFASIYGTSKYGLANSLNVSIEEADSFLKAYFKNLPKLTKFLKDCSNYGLRNGYIRTAKPYSRIRYFSEWNADNSLINKASLGEISRQCGNTVVQGE